MPPLRDRGEDILLIARHFMTELAQQEGRAFKSLSSEAEARLLEYSWPGNVRQLQNVIHNAMILNNGPVLTEEMLPPLPEPTANAPIAALTPAAPERVITAADETIIKLSDMERQYVERAITLCDGNIQLAARKLGISASTIYRKKEAWDAVG